MKKSLILTSCAILAVCAFGAAPASAEHNAMPHMDEAAMQSMMKLSAPGENHKLLEPLVGEWTYTVEMTMMPGAPAQKSEGTSTTKGIMDGRFVQEESHGSMEMNGQKIPFNGLSILGYDNVGQSFTSIWLDNMTTTTMISKGTYDAATKTITFKGEMSCPMTGQKDMKFRSELKVTDANTHSYSMYTADPAGKEFKTLEVNYTRKQ